MAHRVWVAIRQNAGESIWRALSGDSGWPIRSRIRDWSWGLEDNSIWHGIRAYDEAPMRAEQRFLDTYVVPNDARAPAHFNGLVSGYWLGRQLALLVRRPRVLAVDEAGRLHSDRGMAIEYRDGWGFWSWHKVAVPKKVVLAPETFTRNDFLRAHDVEVHLETNKAFCDHCVMRDSVSTPVDSSSSLFPCTSPSCFTRLCSSAPPRVDMAAPRDYI